MPAKTKLNLTDEQRAELEDLRDHAPKAYMRERAAALLKIADGQAVYKVAKEGLPRPRRASTVADCVRRYCAEGVEGLGVRPGRGRKPSQQREAEAAESVAHG